MPEGVDRDRPRGHGARAGRPGARRRSWSCCPGRRASCSAMWPAALATEPVRAVLERATPYRDDTMRMFGVPESELAKSLREIEADVDSRALEITTCLRRARARDRRPLPRRATRRLERAVRAGSRERHGRFIFSGDGETIDEQVARAARRAHDWRSAESCTGGPAGGADHRPPRLLRVLRRRRRRLLERGEGGAARRRPRS